MFPEVEKLAGDEPGGGDQPAIDLAYGQPLDRRNKAGARTLPLQDRFYLIEDLRKPVHRDGEKDEVVVLDDAFEIVRRIDLRGEAGDLVHPAEAPGEVIGQVAGIQMVPVDRLADVEIMVVDDHPLVVPAEFVRERGPEPARPNDGDPAGIVGGVEHHHQPCMTSRAMTIRWISEVPS